MMVLRCSNMIEVCWVVAERGIGSAVHEVAGKTRRNMRSFMTYWLLERFKNSELHALELLTEFTKKYCLELGSENYQL